MGRKRLFISIGIVAGFVALVLFGLIAMIKSEPSFYAQADMPPGPTRLELAVKAQQRNTALVEIPSENNWNYIFSADELNAWFQEDFLTQGGDNNLPDGFHAPRVRFENGKMRFGMRYGTGLFSTILSMEVRLWKVQGQVNMLAMEIVNTQAGRLPFSSAFFLDDISELVRGQKIEISWYRYNGHPVAIIRFQPEVTLPTFQFDKIELRDGTLTISGRSADIGVPQPRTVSK
jgi:hypothetical protein